MTSQTTYLITGANRGLGLELAKQILQEPNSRVVVGARDHNASSLQKLQEEHGDRLLRVRIDLRDFATISAAAKLVKARFGTVDYLINNAGFLGHSNVAEFPTAFKGALEEPFEQMAEIHKINVLGPLAMVRAFLPLLEAGKQRTIVNVTSLAGSIALHQEFLAAPEANMFVQSGLGYKASKTALNMQTSNLANQLGRDGFIIITLHPGVVETDMCMQGLSMWGEAIASFPLISTAESAAKQLNVINKLSKEQNGKMLSYENGEELQF